MDEIKKGLLNGKKEKLYDKAMDHLFTKFEEVNKQRLIDIFDENEQLGNVPGIQGEVYFIRYQLQLIPNPMADHVPSWSPKIDISPKLEDKLHNFMDDQIKARRSKKLLSNYLIHGLRVCTVFQDIKLIFPAELLNIFQLTDMGGIRPTVTTITVNLVNEKHKKAIELIPERILINMII